LYLCRELAFGKKRLERKKKALEAIFAAKMKNKTIKNTTLNLNGRKSDS
jgi:hypothetical protein